MVRVADCHAGVLGSNPGGPKIFSSWNYFNGLAKAQPAVVLILKRVRKRGYGFKSHLTDREKPGIKNPGPLDYKAYSTGDVIL